jgi:NAD(P)-dependent dehydrogenase (short-subunit alcohol dehydrogenase family)
VVGGPPQRLFNTAGVNTFGPAEASTYEDYDWVLGVDLGGVINGMVTFVPRMIKAGGGGYIVTTSSMSGLSAAPTVAPYGAAKAAVINLMEAYYLSLKPYGIGVSVLCPAGIRTNIAEATFTRPRRLRNTGYNVDEKTIAFMRRHYSVGIDPVELARITKKGIEDEVLYILPFPDPEKVLRDNCERIVNYATPEGMKRNEALAKIRREEMMQRAGVAFEGAEEAGWGRARPDLTWVKDHRLFSQEQK